VWRWVLDVVVCPACRERLVVRALSPDGRDGLLGHTGDDPCPEVYPVISAVPRLLTGPARSQLARERADWFGSSPFAAAIAHWRVPMAPIAVDLDVVARFDDEWRSFSNVGTSEQRLIFDRYFDVVPRSLLGEGRLVLDAGCGGGRWAYQVQRAGARVVALDLGQSIEVAERNTRSTGRVVCVQADVRTLPVRSAAFDLAYSLGVLHHLDSTEDAVRGLVSAVRPGGGVLLYLYYALDNRSPAYRTLFAAADAVRQVVSRLPQSAAVAVTTTVAAIVYLPLARLASALRAAGLRRLAGTVPLSFYSDLSFETMRNDSLDRFGTRLEKRFTRNDVERLLESAGLQNIVVSSGPPYWHVLGLVPAKPGEPQ
jgi:SAM-dependent methyltransferase/uncharacterized protein YbaR (Trm112 family)